MRKGLGSPGSLAADRAGPENQSARTGAIRELPDPSTRHGRGDLSSPEQTELAVLQGCEGR